MRQVKGTAMRVLMLGWELPPHITGGLGTACHGLTKALGALGVEVTFVLPRPARAQPGTAVRVLPKSPNDEPARPSVTPHALPDLAAPPPTIEPEPPARDEPRPYAPPPPAAARPAMPGVSVHEVPALVPATSHAATGAYGSRGPALNTVATRHHRPTTAAAESPRHDITPTVGPPVTAHAHGPRHAPATRVPEREPEPAPPRPSDTDLLASSHRYVHLCLELARHETFDVIHAHDWMTFPAAMAVAAASGKAMIAHVHSTEFDRAGDEINYRIFDIERRGVHAAIRVIAVSHLTRSILVNRYDLPTEQVEVVYNGIELSEASRAEPPKASIRPGDRIVLFLGRITAQKGPAQFIAAARRVLERMEGVKFIMAGSGDRVPEVVELAAREGIGHKVLFTGFLSIEDVERVFDMADVYVMPSVSEPFGLAALEAIRHDVPVIVARTAGVSEVIRHALKVDFQDVDDIADKIIAVLRHSALAETLRQNAEIEARRLTWPDAALRVRRTYEGAIAMMPQ